VRFCLGHDGSLAIGAPAVNTFAFWPPMRGLGRYYELTITCRGEADEVTGYFINIRDIDAAARQTALPLIAAAVQGRRGAALGPLLRDIMLALDEPLNQTVAIVELALTPTYRLAIETDDMGTLLITNDYEFSAAHRLHAEQLSDDENRAVFGKCNNPAGHGHNYRVQVTVRGGLDATGEPVAIEKLDELVDRVAIEPLDHKHLNTDVPEFARLNPSVENIARVIYEMLSEPVKPLGVTLEQVKVWETGKTACTYRAT
jgi:6-pyruvoyltetrahydropterin/6-carboxytetrahydropterin synthase